MNSRRKFLGEIGAAGAVVVSVPIVRAGHSAAQDSSVTLALFGDYGSEAPAEQSVAQLVSSWNPDGVFTLGDNVYSGSNADPYEVLQRKAARYYQEFIDRGTFYPSLGNHDWGDPGRPLLWSDGNGGTVGAWHDLFRPPGNGRYYDVRIGDLHVFVLDDYYREPDGNLRGSKQAEWLRTTAAASDATWKIVTHHYPAYVSPDGGFAGIRWPFAQWGIDASFAGHWHHYERAERDGVLYICSGLGGASISRVGAPIAESKKIFNGRHGSVRLRVTPTTFVSEFIDIDGVVRDTRTLTKAGPRISTTQPAPPTTAAPTMPTALPPSTDPSASVPTTSTTSKPKTTAVRRTTSTAVATTLFGASTTTSPSTPPPAESIRPKGQASTPVGAATLNGSHRSASGREASMVRLYLAMFRRAPDDEGLRYWNESDYHLIDIADHFVESSEFGLIYSEVSDADFLQILYGNVLGRQPDPEGRNYWLELLKEGVPRGLILLGFSDSKEFARRSGVLG